MTKREADDAAETFRADLPSDLQSALVQTPEDFGLQFLSVDELIARAESEPADELSARRLNRKQIAAGAGLAAAAAVTAALVVPNLGAEKTPPVAVPPGPTASPTPTPTAVEFNSAREVLLAAAGVRGPSTSGIRYWYVKSVQHIDGQPDIPREIWLGNGRRNILNQDGYLDRLPNWTTSVAGHHLGWAGVQGLPTDVLGLRRLLESDPSPKSQDKGWNTFYAAGELVGEAPLPPKVRSAVWRLLATIPGSEQTDRATDSIGRVGWTVSMSSADEGTLTYIVDPESGELLERRESAFGARPAWSMTFLERGPADSAPPLSGA